MKTYGMLELTVSSPPFTYNEPLSLAEVKTFLALPDRSPEDAAEDSMLEAFIIGAREVAEVYQNRDLILKQYDLTLDYLSGELELRTPLSTVDLIKYRDSTGAYMTLTEGTDYIVDTGRGLVMPPYGSSWPSFTAWPSGAVLVRFTAGFATDHPFWSASGGQRILIGMRQLISDWFHERLPFQMSNVAAQEYPYAVTALFSYGAVPRIR